MRTSFLMLVLGVSGWLSIGQVAAQVAGSTPQNPGPIPVPVPVPHGTSAKGVTAYKVPIKNGQAAAAVDFVHAKSLELPLVAPRSELQAQYDLMDALQARPQLMGAPGFSPGSDGHGQMSPVNLSSPVAAADGAMDVAPQEFGTTNHPFSTARSDLFGLTTSTSYPYRASGKLFFNIGTSSYICSASLIKRGVVVTAAHCVAAFGKNQFYSNWRFVPSYSYSGLPGAVAQAPYGVWTVQTAWVMTSYLNGSDPCAQSGVICQNDVAVLLVNPGSGGTYPGTATGWYGYGYNGYGFTAGGLTQITQIGYPACLDNGWLMERNDSYGYTSGSNSNNTIIGSLMCGGSSGGPWLVNFGIRPTLTSTTPGTPADSNMIVGVTSWGYISNGPKEMGAAPFTSGNIVPLLNAACGVSPVACN